MERHLVARPSTMEAAKLCASQQCVLPALAYGCGRSYGDSALNPGGRLIDCRQLDRFIAFDRGTGVLTCEAGVRLADILAIICQPEADGGGWFPPVTPGTRFVTVGGAIANDVHGKNHQLFGTFGRHVLAFDLARSDGTVLTCTRNENAAMFAATIGGLGLTGVILQATLQLRRVDGLAVEAEDIRFDTLDDFFKIAEASDTDWEYTAAWVDACATGRRLGRGIFSRARHAANHSVTPPDRSARMTVPLTPPRSLATPLTVRAFNTAYLRKLGPRGRTRAIGSYEKVLYPLDAVGRWNRIYGRQGFFQFQCVVPPAPSRSVTHDLLGSIASSGQGSMLSVLKVFGGLASPGLMSFPMQGVTLAFDFPNRGAATRQLLRKLEDVVRASGGRLYPAKDGVMSAESFHVGYPMLERFSQYLDPNFSSAFARRVALTAPSRPK